MVRSYDIIVSFITQTINLWTIDSDSTFRVMFRQWLSPALLFWTLATFPCSALDTFLPDPGIELKANQILKLEHEEGERFERVAV